MSVQMLVSECGRDVESSNVVMSVQMLVSECGRDVESNNVVRVGNDFQARDGGGKS